LCALRCDWLFTKDTTPPQVTMVFPQDSAFVTGALVLQAAATDSGGISKVEFLVDNDVVGTGALGLNTYELSWNSAALPLNTWHAVSARATDLAGNVGFSDTSHIMAAGAQELDVYHGSFGVPAGYFVWLPFDAIAGDSLLGDVQVANGGTLSDFFWCDSANFVLYRNHQTFTPLDRQQNQTAATVAAAVPTPGNYAIVFGNSAGATRTLWVRFSLRRHG
jgi:hypothetical protein